MSRSPAMSGKAIATKLLKEKCSSRVQSTRENGEKEIGGFSTVTSFVLTAIAVLCKPGCAVSAADTSLV